MALVRVGRGRLGDRRAARDEHPAIAANRVPDPEIQPRHATHEGLAGRREQDDGIPRLGQLRGIGQGAHNGTDGT